MRYGFASMLFAFAIALMSGCSHHEQTLPPTAPQGGASTQSLVLQAGKIYQAIPNVFGAARGKGLRDADLDAYIDPSVTGADRVLAHKLMGFMPANMRGDFVYLGPGNRLVSNNPKLMKYIKLTPVQGNVSKSASTSRMFRAPTNSRIQPMDYSSSCSPPNPPTYPMGAYIRQVSQCGFTAAWGFVNIPCGYSSFQNQDSGYLYMELRGNGGSLTEGGFQYNSDTSIAPWLKPPNQSTNVSMNNENVRFTCGMNLGIVHGATQSGAFTYTAVGELPALCDPQQNFCNGNAFTFTGQSWFFLPAPSDINGSGRDPVGDYTPCLNCSISRMTTIAQNTPDWSPDESYFGIATSTEANMINWMQVAFGEWEYNCVPNTTLCTFDYSTWPVNYYGGAQYYPDSFRSESSVSGIFGYGPYESFDGIHLRAGGGGFSRKAAAAFAETSAARTVHTG